MKRTILWFCTLAMALSIAFLTVSAEADAASKKTVYVISSIKCKTASGRIVDTYSYSYNKKGLVSKKTMTTNGTLHSTYLYSYNKDNQIIKETTRQYGETTFVHKYTYEDGLLTKSVLTDKNSGEKFLGNYYYNTKNQLIYKGCDQNFGTKLKYNSKGLVKSTDCGFEVAYKYNSKGFVSKEYMSGKLDRIYKYTYADKKCTRRKTQVCYFGNKKKIGTCYFYYKKIKVDKAYVPAIKKQQIPDVQDELFQMFI